MGRIGEDGDDGGENGMMEERMARQRRGWQDGGEDGRM